MTSYVSISISDEDRITFSHCEEGDVSCIGVLKGYKCIPVYAIEESATGKDYCVSIGNTSLEQ